MNPIVLSRLKIDFKHTKEGSLNYCGEKYDEKRKTNQFTPFYTPSKKLLSLTSSLLLLIHLLLNSVNMTTKPPMQSI